MTQQMLDTLISALPKIPSILNKRKFLNSAVLIPLIFIDGEYHMLFQVRKQHIRQGGEICFPGGMVDEQKDSNPIDTALRETWEELGIDKSSIKIIGCLDTLVSKLGVIVDIVIGIVETEVLARLHINTDEVESVFTLPVSYFIKNEAQVHSVRVELQPSYYDEQGNEQILLPAKELGLPERYHKAWGHKTYPIYVYETKDGVIWGMTAEMIVEFITKIV